MKGWEVAGEEGVGSVGGEEVVWGWSGANPKRNEEEKDLNPLYNLYFQSLKR